MRLTGTGVWSAPLRYGDHAQAQDAAAELEALGYTALWLPDVGGNVLGSVDALLASTRQVVVATGILNIWMHDAAEVAAGYHELVAKYGERFLVGLGVSHQSFIESAGVGMYERPVARVAAYLDALDSAKEPLPVSARVLAALGPKMLGLARDRAAGAHPYLANPAHTARARDVLGPDALLAPEQGVMLESDASVARQVARTHLATYLGLPNYVNNLLRLGLTEDDVRDGGSDRLVDTIIAWGDETAIAARVQEHRDAGADHVCIQALTDGFSFPFDQWRRLAPVLCGGQS